MDLNYKKTITIVTLVLLTLFSNCYGVKNTGRKGSKNLFETFYIGDEGVQYFIKPLSFESENKQLIVDFTFVYKDDLESVVTMNFSLVSESKIDDIDSISLFNDEPICEAGDLKRMFIEKKKDDFLSRFSGQLPLSCLNDFMFGDKKQINLNYQETPEVFIPTSKTQKVLAGLNENLFVLMR